MLTYLRWVFLLVYTTACLIEDPVIDNDAVSKRGLLRTDDQLYFLLANTRPKFYCQINNTDNSIDSNRMKLKWLLDGNLQNTSKTEFGSYPNRNISYAKIFYDYHAGSSFKHRVLKCVLHASDDCHKESTIFLQIARPVSKVEAFFGPNRTSTLTAAIGTQFHTYCEADGEPEPNYEWKAKYPGSTMWNEVGYSKNFTEYVVQEDLPGPTVYRCEAINLANRDTNIMASIELELFPLEGEAEIEPTWVVSVKPLDELVVENTANAGDNGHKVDNVFGEETKVSILSIILAIAAIVIASVLILVGVIAYIKFRRRRLERSSSDNKVSCPMKPYAAPSNSHPHHHRHRNDNGTSSIQSDVPEYDYSTSLYNVKEVPSYIEILDTEQTRKKSLNEDNNLYLTPKSSPKFLPLPNIPGRIPPSSSKNSPVNSDEEEEEVEEENDDYHIYNEIPLYSNDPPTQLNIQEKVN